MISSESTLDINEVRKGVERLFNLYPFMREEYEEYGIDISVYNGDDGCLCSHWGSRVDKLPEPFEDCRGDNGYGKIFIENILEYDESVLEGIICIEEDYDTDSGCCSYSMFLYDEVDFDLDEFIPKVGSKDFNKPRNLPKYVKSFIHSLVASNNLSTVSKLSKRDGEYTISYREWEDEGTDFGLSSVVLKWMKNNPIKDVYIICGEKEISKYIKKKNSYGEYTITIF